VRLQPLGHLSGEVAAMGSKLRKRADSSMRLRSVFGELPL
jgi:hypothetical protein